MRKLLTFAAILFVAALVVTPARASGDSVSVTYPGGGVCSATSVSIPAQVSTSFANPTPFQEVLTLNGTQIGTNSGTQPAGNLSYAGGFGASFPAQAFPYTFQDVAVLGQFTIVITAQCASSGAGPVVTISINGNVVGSVFWDPGDDRLNRDPGQPAALYCRNGDVQVWRVDLLSSRGTLAINASKNEIIAVKNRKPTHNTLIKASADGKLKLYYLPATDELSFITTYLNSDKPYTFVWKGCK